MALPASCWDRPASRVPALGAHRATARRDELRRWASARLSGSAHEQAPVDLLGLGPGLTPSGDDLLCGALVALRAVGRVDASRRSPRGNRRRGTRPRHPLSNAFLQAAAEGHGYEALHTMIIALLENRPFARDLEALGRIGHDVGLGRFRRRCAGVAGIQ